MATFNLLPKNRVGGEAFKRYFDEIRDNDVTRANAKRDGGAREGGGELGTSREEDQGEEDPSEEVPYERGDDFYLPSRHLRHSGGTIPPDGDTPPVTAGKKIFDQSTLPWSGKQPNRPLQGATKIRLERKRNYLVDPKAVKIEVLCHPDCPPMPDGIWTEIISSSYVELDKVFVGRFSLVTDSKHTESVGDFEISFKNGGARTDKGQIIRTHGHWTIAWGLYRTAVLFLYPERRNELERYSEYIVGQFTAIHAKEHYRVINFDKAVRRKHAQCNWSSLDDMAPFSDLYTEHLNPAGASSSHHSDTLSSSKRPYSAMADPGSPICLRYQRGRCTPPCSYRHVCDRCEGKHPERFCNDRRSERKEDRSDRGTAHKA